MKIAVIGTGEWGSAIGKVLMGNKIDVSLVSRNDFEVLHRKAFDIVFIALRTNIIEGFLEQYLSFLPNKICLLSKGIFNNKVPFFSTFFEENNKSYALLSGPNFADELCEKKDTITTIASKNSSFLETLKSLLEVSYFHIETSSFVKSVEIYAIFKNIIAIYAGYMEGKGYSCNTKSKLITLLISEMVSVVKVFNEPIETFFLSAGIGDIFLTCTSNKSRNFQYGFNFQSAVHNTDIAVEGVRSLSAIPTFEKLYNIKFKLYREFYDLISGT